MGSSLGGYLAQQFAHKHPDRVDVLIAANTLSSTVGIAEKPPYAGDLEGVPIKLLRQGFMHGLKQREAQRPSEKQLYQILFPEVQGGIPARHLRARLLALKHAPPIGEIPLPGERIAVVESDDDPLIIPPVRDGVRAFLNPGTVYRFSKGGHFPYVVRPNAYLSLLEEQMGLEITGTNWGKGKVRSL
jgi:pimeloyl-ACP methyl ester carboxylesterase